MVRTSSIPGATAWALRATLRTLVIGSSLWATRLVAKDPVSALVKVMVISILSPGLIVNPSRALEWVSGAFSLPGLKLRGLSWLISPVLRPGFKRVIGSIDVPPAGVPVCSTKPLVLTEKPTSDCTKILSMFNSNDP